MVGAGDEGEVEEVLPSEQGPELVSRTDAGGDGDRPCNSKSKGSALEQPAAKKKRVLRCSICSGDHFTSSCPQLHGHKPAATFCGLAGDGLGFFHIPADGTTPAVMSERESATALITVTRGVVPPELLKSELTRILPVEWEWEIQEHGDKAYVVPFPCKIELDRMVAIGTVTAKRNEGALPFEEFNSEIKPLRKLQQVWVRVFGVPLEIRSFLPLWAVGTILGATQKVDIGYLRRTGVVRLLVAVLDVGAVPKDADVVVNRSTYRIFFKVDEVLRDEDGFNPDDDDLLVEHDQTKDQDMDESETHEQNENSPDVQPQPAALNWMSPTKQAALVEEAIDLACERLIEELSFKVMNEPDDIGQFSESTDPVHDELIALQLSKETSKTCEVVSATPNHASEDNARAEEPMFLGSAAVPEQGQKASYVDVQSETLAVVEGVKDNFLEVFPACNLQPTESISYR
jgi:hypothetical protein